MAQISVFAQPGLAFMGAEREARTNRLAAARESAQQALRQQAFTSLQGAPDAQANPQAMAAQLAAAGDTEGANLALRMGTAQESRQASQQRQEETRRNRRNEILQAMAGRDDLDNPDVIEGFNRRLESVGESVDTVRPLLPTFQSPREFELIEPGSPDYPPGGQGAYQRNRRTGQITAVAGTRPSELGQLAGAITASNAQNQQFNRDFLEAMNNPRVSPAIVAEANGLRSSYFAADTFLNVAEELKQAIEETGGVALFGGAGIIRRNVTGITGTLRELSNVTGESAGAARAAISAIESATDDAASSGMDSELFETLFGNSQIAAVDLLANALSYMNARIYEPTGPLSAADVRAHAIDPGFFGSTADGIARVDAAMNRARRTQQGSRRRMDALRDDPVGALFTLPESRETRAPGQPAPTAPASVRPLRDLDSVPLSEWTDAELRAYEGAGGE
jgi:hypothetical protein